jgi:hypothetical protein
MHIPRPFKNPQYNKNVNRRAKNLKAVLSQERERERAERERRRLLQQEKAVADGRNETQIEDESAMDVDDVGAAEVVKKKTGATKAAGKLAEAADNEEEVPTCESSVHPYRQYF